jgi:toxin ParE1/3/4
VTIVWSARALRDLRDQRQYIARSQPSAATRIAERIVAVTDYLAIYPEYGRATDWDETGRVRELVVAGMPFVVLYTLTRESVIVLRLFHAAQRRGT